MQKQQRRVVENPAQTLPKLFENPLELLAKCSHKRPGPSHNPVQTLPKLFSNLPVIAIWLPNWLGGNYGTLFGPTGFQLGGPIAYKIDAET